MTTIAQCAGTISSLSVGEPRAEDVKIGLALGAGGANGLAHIAIRIRDLAAGSQ